VALADEMALTVYRTARSFVVKEALDFSTALFMADGQLIAQGRASSSTSVPCPSPWGP
jgi:N-methylhydantoinase B